MTSRVIGVVILVLGLSQGFRLKLKISDEVPKHLCERHLANIKVSGQIFTLTPTHKKSGGNRKEILRGEGKFTHILGWRA